MPPVDPSLLPPNWQSQPTTLAGPPPMPPALPGATAPRRLVHPQRQLEQANDAARLGIAQQGAVNDQTRVGLSQQDQGLQTTEHNWKKTDREANSGVDTGESQDQAAGHVVTIVTDANLIKKAVESEASAEKPGWIETAVGWVTDTGKAASQSGARQVVDTSYKNILDSALYLATGAAYNERQEQIKNNAFVPLVTDKPELLAAKRARLEALIAQARVRAGPANKKVQEALDVLERSGVIDAVFKNPTEVPEQGLDTELSSDKQALTIPKGYQAKHDAFFHTNPRPTIEQYNAMRQRLDEEFKEEMNGARTNFDQTPRFLEQLREGGNIGPITPESRDLSEREQQNAKIAMHPGAILTANLANSLTGGGVDLLASKEDDVAFDIANKEHSEMALLGEVAGSIVPLSASQRAIMKIFPSLSKTARKRFGADILGNAAYGGLRGFTGAEEGEGLFDTVTGALGGTAGAVVGNLVTKGTTPLLSEATESALNKLSGVKKGVLEKLGIVNRNPPTEVLDGVEATTFQRLGLGRMEEALQGLPFVGKAREKALDSNIIFNGNRALRNVGEKLPDNIEPGVAINKHINEVLNAKYNNIRPQIVGAADGPYDNAVIALHRMNTNTPEKKALWDEIQAALDKFKDPNTGHYNGQGYKEASERLRHLTKTWFGKMEKQGDVAAGDMARAAEKVRGQIQALVQRQTPAVAKELKGIEKAWAHSVRLEDATNRALANGGKYSPGHYTAATKKFDTSVRKGASARGTAFDEDYALAASRVLGSKGVPDISPGTTATVLGLIGATGVLQANDVQGSQGLGTAAKILGLIAAGAYGPGARQVVQKALRGQRSKAVDNEIVLRIIQDATRNKMTGE